MDLVGCWATGWAEVVTVVHGGQSLNGETERFLRICRDEMGLCNFQKREDSRSLECLRVDATDVNTFLTFKIEKQFDSFNTSPFRIVMIPHFSRAHKTVSSNLFKE